VVCVVPGQNNFFRDLNDVELFCVHQKGLMGFGGLDLKNWELFGVHDLNYVVIFGECDQKDAVFLVADHQ